MSKVLMLAVLVMSLAVPFFKAERPTLNERCSELDAGGRASVAAAPTTVPVVLVRNAERAK